MSMTPCLGKVNRRGQTPTTRGGQVAPCISRNQSSSPSQTSLTQPEPVLNTAMCNKCVKNIIKILLNVILTILIERLVVMTWMRSWTQWLACRPRHCRGPRVAPADGSCASRPGRQTFTAAAQTVLPYPGRKTGSGTHVHC